jgi:hypothetical protein
MEMNRSKGAFVVTAALIAVISLVHPGCEEPIAPDYLLNQPRILAIRSEPPDLIPLSQVVAEGQVTLDALLYLPPGSPAPTYSWSWCTTVDATLQCATTAAQLEAIVDPGASGITIDFDLGSAPTAVFAYPVSPAILQGVCVRRFTEDGGLVDDGGVVDDAGNDAEVGDGAPPGVGLACTGDSWPVSILLTVNVGATTLLAERSLTVYLTPPASANTNPTIDGLRPFTAAITATDGGAIANVGEESDGAVEDAGVGGAVDGSIELAAEVPVSATDFYVGRLGGGGPGDASALDADAETCVPGDDVDGGPLCATLPEEVVSESLTMAWYAGGGELANATTAMAAAAYGAPQDWSSLVLNRWTPPAAGQTVAAPVIVVVRDNRGGIGWLVTSSSASGASN